MYNPVDFTNLREITEGDTELEKELFDDFISSCEEKFIVMAENCIDGESLLWESSAHALKGISMNLGADNLAALCQTAQENSVADIQSKQDMLSKIKAEYALVKKVLDEV